MPRLRLFQAPAPDAGIDKRYPATFIDNGASPSAENIRAEAGVVFKRKGYTTLTSVSLLSASHSGVASGVTSGPMLGQNFGRYAGTVSPMLATVGALFYWDGDDWQFIKTGLNGSESGYHSATLMNDTWLYTNGVDNVQVWTGTGETSDLGGASDYQTSDTHLCRAIIAFSGRLLLLGTNEDGTWYPYRVRWSELGKTNEFDTDEGGGYYDLLEDPSGIYGAALLGNYCIIYTGDSIWIGTYVGGTVVNTFSRVVSETGCRAPRTILNITNNEHIFMGNDNVYRFNGGAVLPVGDAIRQELFSGVARANFMCCHACIEPNSTRYHLFVPYGNDDGTITRAYIYDWDRGTWMIDSRADITVAVALQLGKILYIDDLPSDPIDAMPGDAVIDDLGGQENRQLMIYGDGDGHIFQDNGLYVDDNGTAVDAFWDSKDFTLDAEYIDNYKRVEEILFDARGNTVTVRYSTDKGSTWTTADTVTLSGNYARYMVPIDVTARDIRLRFQNDESVERFWLRWIGIKYFVEAEW